MMTDVALLVLRVVVGALLVGHGGQKLFGWFGGHGLRGTGMWLESLGLRPGSLWAPMAGLSELGGGALMLLGFLNPLGPIAVMVGDGDGLADCARRQADLGDRAAESSRLRIL